MNALAAHIIGDVELQPLTVDQPPAYVIEVTEYSLERSGVRRSLHGVTTYLGERYALPYHVAAHRAHMLNQVQGLMLSKGPRTHVLTARVVPAPDDLTVPGVTLNP